MKASTLIKILKDIQDKEGDIDVVVRGRSKNGFKHKYCLPILYVLVNKNIQDINGFHHYDKDNGDEKVIEI